MESDCRTVAICSRGRGPGGRGVRLWTPITDIGMSSTPKQIIDGVPHKLIGKYGYVQVLYDCGICGALHPWGWDGDCRDNGNRFNNIEAFANFIGVRESDVEVRSWEQRNGQD